MKKKYTPFILFLFFCCLAIAIGLMVPGKKVHTPYEDFILQETGKNPGCVSVDRDEKTADRPDMAAFQNFLMTVDPALGVVPRERLSEAYRIAEALRDQKSGSAALEWENLPSDMGGRMRAIMYDPNDPLHKKVWAGGVTGGLWYNNDITNPNSSWIPVGDFWSCLAVRCITYDPNNTMVFYVGTGEPETAMPQYRESSGIGNGIWRSVDGGQTWNLLPSTSGFVYITDIVVKDEGSSSVLFAGVVSGQYHGIHQSQPSDGLYRSVDDGATWEQVLPDIYGSSDPYAPSDIALTSDGTRLIVGTMPNLNGEGGATLLTSDYGTAGSWFIDETYKQIIESEPEHPIPGRIVLACAPSDPNVVYALVASGYLNLVNNFQRFNCWHILRSSDKGDSWTEKNLPYDNNGQDNFATLAWHALDIAVDPNDPNSLYIGGLDIQKSTDGGSFWTRVSDWSLMYWGGGPQYIHADQHIIAYKPGSSSEILFGTDGGVFYTSSGSSPSPVFEEHNKNFNTLQFYTCAINPTAGSIEGIGGLQDNGSLYYIGIPLTPYNMVSGGDGAFAFYDKNDPDYFITSIYYNYYIVFYNGIPYNDIYDFYASGIFVNPADFDPVTNTLYANAVDFISSFPDLYLQISNVTVNGGYSGTFKNANTGSPVYFSAVKWSPHSPSGQATLFLGTVAGRLFKLVHAESTPVVTEITGTNFPDGNISSIDIGGSDDTLVVTFSNYGIPSVWQSYNGGQTWQDKEGNLPDMPIRWVLYHPESTKHALLATETGVWSTSNLNQANVVWTPDVAGMANVRVDMLSFRESDNTVLAASHGRGLFTAIWDVVTGTGEKEKPDLRIYPNPTTGIANISFTGGSGNSLKVAVTDLNGRILLEENRNTTGSSPSRVDLSPLPNGVYFIHIIRDGKTLKTEKIILTR
jgi:hypothetical protein